MTLPLHNPGIHLPLYKLPIFQSFAAMIWHKTNFIISQNGLYQVLFQFFLVFSKFLISGISWFVMANYGNSIIIETSPHGNNLTKWLGF